VAEVSRKKRRNTGKATARAIAGVSLEVINKRRTEKPEVRQASRDAALREIKERAKKAKAEKVQAAANIKSKAPVAKNVKGKGR
jgi:large subunit ribosomal protein L24e